MKIEFVLLTNFPFNGFLIIQEESIQEGFNFLNRLENDWLQNKNRFNKEGESFWLIKVNDEIIGLGGINQSPFHDENSKIGRLRRFYLLKKWRRNGILTKFLHFIISNSKKHFNILQLKTDNPNAKLFYKSIGFIEVFNNRNYNFELNNTFIPFNKSR